VSEQSTRTLVCSVLFLDIVGYSKQAVVDQVRLKQTFNAVLAEALEQVDARERVVVDTGDGAAMTFLDPESALYVALAILDNVGEMKVRMGINLGPVSLMKDLNGMDNVIGDGINVAQRVMSFAESGQLFVSRSFYEVVSRLSHGYALMFQYEGARTDKHVREHDVYALAEAVREGRRVAEEQARRRRKGRGAPTAEPAGGGAVTISDVGTHYLIAGPTRPSVEQAIEGLVRKGCELVSPISQVGAKWLASCAHPRLGSVKVEALGLKRVVSGSSREVVEAKVRELVNMGARLVQEVELEDGVWTAVCESQ
jgi:class 3 adenylate cyclase